MPRVWRRRWRDPETGERRESIYWYLEYQLAGRTVRVRTHPPTASKRVALEQLARLVATSDAPGRDVTVSALLERYRAYLRAHSPTTLLRCGSRLEWWEARFRGLPAASLSPHELERAVADLHARGYAESTVSGYWTLLRAALRRAVRDGLLESDPTARTPREHELPGAARRVER